MTLLNSSTSNFERTGSATAPTVAVVLWTLAFLAVIDVGVTLLVQPAPVNVKPGPIQRRFEEGRSVFERSSAHHHDHMVDIDSGDVVEFVNDDIEKLQQAVAEQHGYEIVSHNLVLFVRPKGKKR